MLNWCMSHVVRSVLDELNTTQEEADTCMLLHAKQAAADYTSVIIVADDTDVLILCLAFNPQISCNLYVRRGTKTRLRVCCQAVGK